MKNKNRLISLDYALQQLNIGELENGGSFETDSAHVKDFLNALPTVDVVEVINEYYNIGLRVGFNRAKKVYHIKD